MQHLEQYNLRNNSESGFAADKRKLGAHISKEELKDRWQTYLHWHNLSIRKNYRVVSRYQGGPKYLNISKTYRVRFNGVH